MNRHKLFEDKICHIFFIRSEENEDGTGNVCSVICSQMLNRTLYLCD